MKRGSAPFGSTMFLAGLVVLVLLAHILAPSSESVLAGKLQNSLHGPGFAALAAITLAVFRRTNSHFRAYFLAAALCVLLGISGEILQLYVARDASTADLLNDLAGAGGTLFLVAVFDSAIGFGDKSALRAVTFVSALLMLFIGLSPFLWYSYASLQKIYATPKILCFEHLWEKEVYQMYGHARLSLTPKPPEWPTSGKELGKITSGSSSFSGLRIDPPSDWSEFDALTFWAETTSEHTDRWTVRINDSSHNNRFDDRFNTVIEVGNNPLKFRISLSAVRSAPKTRTMDMRQISSIELFHQSSDETSTILVDDFRLEK